MHLLLAVINEPERVDDIIAGFFEIGLRGATVISSEGMGNILSHEIPIFAGLQRICGDMEQPATGIAMTIPLDRVVGLAPRRHTSDGDQEEE